MDSELDWHAMQERYGAQASETEGGVPPAEDVTVRGLGEPHSVEVMVYQYDKLFGYGCWMTSVLTLTHIFIF